MGGKLHGKNSRNRSGNDQLGDSCDGRWGAHCHSNCRGRETLPVGGRGEPQDGGTHGGPGGKAPGRHQFRKHHILDQASHGAQIQRSRGRKGAQGFALQDHRERQWRCVGGDGGQRVLSARDLGDDPGQAQGRCRGVPGREGDSGRDHRAGLL